ncbi:hypothetical protein B0A54_06292 [Friedmanniomyces endolithicus]|uniref:Uncharacterized protein n=1 Tax=Friedmanniomyces endolithicus TaxID=329885 RepID=A0A4U0UYR8_9PEZI|nr:hypothetical protein LTS09_001801 [Friedmanniomyces endolithicus]TKA41390.1 hypothetical protein B0A54_06292 [Friedmanniomyces endolithicus]
MASAPATMSTRYTIDELKSLGRACSNRLPPASAVQAMFLYEMQRQTEIEKLFHSRMFELARAKDSDNSTAIRVQKLEVDLKDLRRRIDASDLQERLATSQVRFTAQQAKIDGCDAKSAFQDQRIATLETALADVNAVKTANPDPTLNEEAVSNDLATIQADVEALYDERDALINMHNESNARIQKLEDLVRQLTLQMSINNSPSNSSPAMVQRLPMQNTNGQAIELTVPRGGGLSSGKENRVAARTFTPGEPWAR